MTNSLIHRMEEPYRMITEYLQPKSKFKKFKVMDTIVFFGSARLKSKRDALKDYNHIKKFESKTDRKFCKKTP